ncbi:MAG: hypothetical protein DWG76_03965 [Chloroflexi bacterium]|nr:hypothetical protein [Chloroflexota bacterium]
MNLETSLILFAFLLILVFSLLARRPGRRALRDIPAFSKLRKTIELSVEDGSRLQVSLGSGGIFGPQSAAALAGLTLLRQISSIASDSDAPPIATSGDGVLALLSQDTLRRTYRDLGLDTQFSNRLARVTGLTPFSYGAGTMPLILDSSVSASALMGSFGEEAALITAAGQRKGAFSLAGSYGLAGQALLFASSEQPLLGEELFAAGAYLDAGRAHRASLHAQDVLRWLIILVIASLAFGGLLGLAP